MPEAVAILPNVGPPLPTTSDMEIFKSDAAKAVAQGIEVVILDEVSDQNQRVFYQELNVKLPKQLHRNRRSHRKTPHDPAGQVEEETVRRKIPRMGRRRTDCSGPRPAGIPESRGIDSYTHVRALQNARIVDESQEGLNGGDPPPTATRLG